MKKTILLIVLLSLCIYVPAHASYVGDVDQDGSIDLTDVQQLLAAGDIAAAYDALAVTCGASAPVEAPPEWLNDEDLYQIDSILTGTQSKEINVRAEKAKFDERLSLLNLLLDAVSNDMKQVITQEEMMKILMDTLRGSKTTIIGNSGDKAAELLEKTASKQEKAIANSKKAGTISDKDAIVGLRAAKTMRRMQKQILEKRPDSGSVAFTLIKEEFGEENNELKKQAQLTRQRLENMFSFCENVFPNGQELLVLVTELTLRPYAARFIGKYGCDGYFRNNKNLLFYERKTEILQQIQEMNL